MRRNKHIPAHFGTNAARTAQTRYLRGKTPESERLAEIAEAERVLSGDEACIRACLDALNGKYKEVIVMRYVRGYSWAKISARLGTADSTARDWHTRAMERLGEVLEELPEAEALARRASRART